MEAVATHRLLDRLISGRIWIGVIAFALIGIVTMQLGLLKLNAGIGRSLQREALLQRENATLSAENSEMGAGERVEAQAEHLGMEQIPAGALRFLTARPAVDPSRAAAALSTPISTATGEALTPSATTATGETATPAATTATGETATPAVSTATGETARRRCPRRLEKQPRRRCPRRLQKQPRQRRPRQPKPPPRGASGWPSCSAG